MKFDNILDEVKGCGLFQLLVLLMLSIPRMVTPGHFLLNNFIGWTPPHHCDLSSLADSAPGLFGNLSQEQMLAVGIPLGGDGRPDSCRMFAEPQLQLLDNVSAGAHLPAVACRGGWVYDNDTFTSTLATEVKWIIHNSAFICLKKAKIFAPSCFPAMQSFKKNCIS